MAKKRKREMKPMNTGEFLGKLQTHRATFAKAVATNEGDWIIKGFIDIYRQIYTISVDTKIVSKVLELLLFPMFVDFAKKHGLDLELSPQQNFYPDLTFIDKRTAITLSFVQCFLRLRVDDSKYEMAGILAVGIERVFRTFAVAEIAGRGPQGHAVNPLAVDAVRALDIDGELHSQSLIRSHQ